MRARVNPDDIDTVLLVEAEFECAESGGCRSRARTTKPFDMAIGQPHQPYGSDIFWP